MTTMPSSAALAVIEPAFSETEKLALAGSSAGYSGMTREAYTLDLRQFTAWCRERQLRLFAARRAEIELFARDLEAAGRARATITRRLSTIAGLYKYAVEEDLLDRGLCRTSSAPDPGHLEEQSGRVRLARPRHASSSGHYPEPPARSRS